MSDSCTLGTFMPCRMVLVWGKVTARSYIAGIVAAARLVAPDLVDQFAPQLNTATEK